MGFRNKTQLARACHVLLVAVGLGHLWTRRGPTHQASYVQSSGLSDPARAMLRAAWFFWSKHEDPSSVAHLVSFSGEIDPSPMLAELLSAVRTDTVDRWLNVYGAPDEDEVP